MNPVEITPGAAGYELLRRLMDQQIDVVNQQLGEAPAGAVVQALLNTMVRTLIACGGSAFAIGALVELTGSVPAIAARLAALDGGGLAGLPVVGNG